MATKEVLIKLYFESGFSYTDITALLRKYNGITLSTRQLKRILRVEGLSRRIHYSDIADVAVFIMREVDRSGLLHGYRWMYYKCRAAGFHVRKEDVRLILKEIDPHGVEFRQRRRLFRRRYASEGPNYVWHLDSYDKLKPFGIAINGCIDGFSRYMLWLNAYPTNNDPRIIAGYFVEYISKSGGCPMVIRADYGTENSSVRNLQTFLRRNQTDVLAGQNSFLYGTSVTNQRIESWWGILRKECVEFYINLFHQIKDEGYFNGTYLDKALIQFCFMAIIQVRNCHPLVDSTLLPYI